MTGVDVDTRPPPTQTCRDESARNLLVKWVGLTVYRLDNDTYEVYDGNPDTGWTEVAE